MAASNLPLVGLWGVCVGCVCVCGGGGGGVPESPEVRPGRGKKDDCKENNLKSREIKKLERAHEYNKEQEQGCERKG